MFPISKKGKQTELTDKRPGKFTPLDAEKLLPELQPRDEILHKKLKTWKQQKEQQISNDTTLDDQQKLAQLIALEFNTDLDEKTKFFQTEKSEFVTHFIDWLNFKDPTVPRNPYYLRDKEKVL